MKSKINWIISVLIVAIFFNEWRLRYRSLDCSYIDNIMYIFR
jgi:hypothetical protein